MLRVSCSSGTGLPGSGWGLTAPPPMILLIPSRVRAYSHPKHMDVSTRSAGSLEAALLPCPPLQHPASVWSSQPSLPLCAPPPHRGICIQVRLSGAAEGVGAGLSSPRGEGRSKGAQVVRQWPLAKWVYPPAASSELWPHSRAGWGGRLLCLEPLGSPCSAISSPGSLVLLSDCLSSVPCL